MALIGSAPSGANFAAGASRFPQYTPHGGSMPPMGPLNPATAVFRALAAAAGGTHANPDIAGRLHALLEPQAQAIEGVYHPQEMSGAPGLQNALDGGGNPYAATAAPSPWCSRE